ncbi:aromatic-ring-hydroxylating dioxygenase subunit beta [Nocardia sp. CA-135953]|uniref:aromatic-ring-hydroxylating dioxygenase subunit beta n=1 Tax=Nocardia sp. CA-135953 TaxID=3239978 RepID=UPI003D970023
MYDRLRSDSRWWSENTPVSNGALRAEAEAFLFLEARLLDDGRFEDWLDLYSDDCVYWVPSHPGGGDPETEVSIALDDRRRLEDRIVWLRSAYIWSQIPKSRTVRMLSNVEVARDGEDVLVRSNFVLHEARGPRHATHFGWLHHRIAAASTGWNVRAKHVYLVESDQPHENMSIVL